jgi:hypothetical protein
MWVFVFLSLHFLLLVYLSAEVLRLTPRCLLCCLTILEPGGLELLNLGLLAQCLIH